MIPKFPSGSEDLHISNKSKGEHSKIPRKRTGKCKCWFWGREGSGEELGLVEKPEDQTSLHFTSGHYILASAVTVYELCFP